MGLDVSKLGVINRDYQSIFTDLVNTIPSLTEQWNTNDESDPGIVLVKLMSMLGDMLSYNTDKAYLEAFPDTVTQRKNAYQIFRLMGYKMKWYRSAKCDCYFTNNSQNIVTIPRFTKILSADRTVCYTNPYDHLEIVGGIDGSKDPRNHTQLVEGIPVTPDLLLSTITANSTNNIILNSNEKWHSIYKYNVDKDIIVDSRIYFDYNNVDQDHIILIDDQGEEWTLVENINLSASSGSKIFEFSVDEFDKPYIKLIDYWENLGINNFKLFYIISSGSKGQITSNVLCRISSDVYNILNRNNRSELILKHSESTYGYDPETPDEARRDSRNYVNTFNTLITLEDFTKFVKRSEVVGNAVSYDSLTDINKYAPILFESIKDLALKLINADSSIEYIKNGIPAETNNFYTTIRDKVVNDIAVTDDKEAAAKEIYKIVSNYTIAGQKNTTENDRYEVEHGYKDKTGRSLTDDLVYLCGIYGITEEVATNNVNIYVSKGSDYYSDEFSNYAYLLYEDLENAKMMPIDVHISDKGINYYDWLISGTLYLKTPVAFSKAQEILVSINNKLKEVYAIENMEYNTPIKTIDLVNTILSVDSSIYYVDLGNIIYRKTDDIVNTYEETSDKTVISGEKFIRGIKISDIKDDSTGRFKINLLDTGYMDYSSQELNHSNILLKPGSVSIILENGSYIVRDNGYGSLVCNENIIKSSQINYRDDGNGILIEFELYPEIKLISETLNLKFSHNRINMTRYAGLDPELFVIDSDSIEL